MNLRGVNATTHCVAPLLIVHGERSSPAGYNGGIGAFGPGNRANATTGRAVRLVLLHVAGAVPGPGDASTQGGPAKYTYCVAENLAATPWESYALSRGVDAQSAVTVHCGEAPHNFHDMESEHPARSWTSARRPWRRWGRTTRPSAKASTSSPWARSTRRPSPATVGAGGTSRRTCSTKPACRRPCSGPTSSAWPGSRG